jgi:hypothetical protein
VLILDRLLAVLCDRESAQHVEADLSQQLCAALRMWGRQQRREWLKVGRPFSRLGI